MGQIEMLEFSLKSALSSPINIVFALVSCVAAFLFVLFWRWSISKQGGEHIIPGVVAAVVCSVCNFLYLGIENSDTYIATQKSKLGNQLREDPIWRNDALSRAWGLLDGDAKIDLKPIEEGGVELRISSSADSQIYAQQAAQALEDNLRLRDDLPRTVKFASKEDIAIQVMAASPEFQSMSDPRIIGQDNSIASKIMEIRLEEVFVAVYDGVNEGKGSVKQLIIWIAIILVVICSTITSVAAWKNLASKN